MRVLVTGAAGQLGHELAATVPAGVEAVMASRADLDLSDPASVEAGVAKARAEAVINAAAYTQVDRAETERDAAFAANAEGAGRLAAAAAAQGARFLHVSTDFVFGGASAAERGPADATSPLGVYGESKLEGERLVTEATGGAALILRTSWLYSRHGRNFATSMLERMRRPANDATELRIVADQVGTPTWARGLARALWLALERDLSGIHHWTDAGVASWYDFAVAIHDEAMDLGLLDTAVPIHPIRTEDYPTPARRPVFSVLDKTATWQALGVEPVHWRRALRNMMEELPNEPGSAADA